MFKTQLLHLIELGITFDVSHDKLQVKGDLTKLDDNSKATLFCQATFMGTGHYIPFYLDYLTYH
ncbi:MAG: hypothetical protein HRT38_06855 [Alteromonadaceae bacterium]|nr:hypothetical protein [Alteromonadaceae bacterium]